MEISPAQYEAIKVLDGPVLVLSAAGTGKTRVLVYRIVELIKKGVDPCNILAVTFTNKAAKEMKSRIHAIVGKDAKDIWIGTFHGISLRILKQHGHLLGYSSNFTILDENDQMQILKRVCKKLGYNYDAKKLGNIQRKISECKVKLLSTSDIYADKKNKDFADIYMEYQHTIMSQNSVDFDDIIGQTIRLLNDYPEVRNKYQSKFKYVLGDEIQDVNNSQYVLLKLLSLPQNNLFIVGDDAQSIFAFRLADMTNILNFENDYPNAEVILLEENFRSTGNIIKAANELINNNVRQRKKHLWTNNENGDKIVLHEATNDLTEAKYVVDKIQYLVRNGTSYNSCAILYRTSSQSRVFEDILIRQRIPYVIYNGLSFYERKEIKDIMAYLRVIANPKDNISLTRIINVPARSIGNTTIEKLMRYAEDNGITLYETLAKADEVERLSSKIRNNLKDLYSVFENLRMYKDNMEDLLNALLLQSGYMEMLEEDLREAKGEEINIAQGRINNIGELQNIVKYFSDEGCKLDDFLQEMALLSDSDKATNKNGVQLMTVHTAKGLEFENVFIVGMEEELFPHQLSIIEGNLEEERRLCYVAITRAIKRLFITYADYRMLFGRKVVRLRSRFIDELPEDVIIGE